MRGENKMAPKSKAKPKAKTAKKSGGCCCCQ